MKKFFLLMAVAMCVVSCHDHRHGSDDVLDELDHVNPAKLAVLKNGTTFNEAIKCLVKDGATVESSDYKVLEIVFQTESTDNDGVIVSTDNSPYPVYASFDAENRTVYVKSRSRGFKVMDASSMFVSFERLVRLDLSTLYMAECEDLSCMFKSCCCLDSLDLSGFNTSRVKNMRGMFSECNALTSLDVSSFNTENVEDMGYMFARCSSLKRIGLSHFNTAKVVNMTAMFQSCTKLDSLDLSGFSTENVESMDFMFGSCKGLTYLDLSSFNTTKVTNMHYMLSWCWSLRKLVLGDAFVVSSNRAYMCHTIGSENVCEIVCTESAKKSLLDPITDLYAENIQWTVK